jgi:hypothetical protein
MTYADPVAEVTPFIGREGVTPVTFVPKHLADHTQDGAAAR